MKGPTLAALLAALLLPVTAHAARIVKLEAPNKGIEAFELDLGGYVQPRFRFVQSDEDAGHEGELGFSIARARVEFKGKLVHQPRRKPALRLGWAVSFELMPEARLQDAYVDVGVGDHFAVRAGQFKVPFSGPELTSDKRQLFPERADVTDLGPSRDMGLMVHGHAGRRHLEYGVGIFNGEGRNRLANVNKRLLYAARLAISPLGSPGNGSEILRDAWARPDGLQIPFFTLAYGIHFNTVGPKGQEESYLGHNAEALFHYRWITVRGAFLYVVHDYQDTTLADFDAFGGFVQLGLFPPMVPWVEDHVALLFRFEQLDEFKGTDFTVPLAGPTDPAQARREFSAGVGFFFGPPLFAGMGDLRVQLVYTHRQELEDQPYDDDRLVVAVHFGI